MIGFYATWLVLVTAAVYVVVQAVLNFFAYVHYFHMRRSFSLFNEMLVRGAVITIIVLGINAVVAVWHCRLVHLVSSLFGSIPWCFRISTLGVLLQTSWPLLLLFYAEVVLVQFFLARQQLYIHGQIEQKLFIITAITNLIACIAKGLTLWLII